MRIVNILFILLFILSAALQYNDPDPYVWMPIYLWGAMLCYMALKGKYNVYFYLTGLVVYFSYGIYLFLDKTGVKAWWLEYNAESLFHTMKATKPWIEETREFLGLMILIIALVLNMVWLNNRKSEKITSA